MARSSKRRSSSGHSSSSERWLVSYSDLITLLFALFVILYAMSQSDLAKFKKVSQSMKEAFDPSQKKSLTKPEADLTGPSMADPFQAESREFNRMQDELEQSIQTAVGSEQLPEKFALLQDERGLIVRIAVKDFFLEGSAEVPDDLKPILLRIGKTLGHFEKKIKIEGYTDLAESHPKDFPSGWELSSARAASVARLWVQALGMDPRRLSITGYGHYQPLTDKTGEWLRSLNRRIEILVLRTISKTTQPPGQPASKSESP